MPALPVESPPDGSQGLTVVAIDGPAGSGKSTVSRALAAALGLDYLDTGAMYRGVTFAALRRNIDPADQDVVGRLARQLDLDISDRQILVDGVDATIEIRGPEVTRAVSSVAANAEVRTELRRRQREWAEERGGGVVEGRDIGSVVFPDADLKVYLTASPDVRAKRRAKEVTDLDYETVAADIARRDAADQGRDDSPLAQADGAVVVDTTGRDVADIVADLVARLRPTSTAPTSTPPTAPTGYARTGSRGELALFAVVRGALVGACRLWFRVSARGTEHVPTQGAFILSPVHRSNLDFALVLITTKRRIRFLAKDTLWKGQGFWAWLFTALGAIPVARGTADRDALRTCVEVVQAGEPLVVFPEGTRQRGPEVQHCFDGPAFVQSRTGVPIIPVGIGGSEGAMPKGSKIPKPRKVRLVVGPPLTAGDAAGSKARRAALRARTAELHHVLQDLFDQAQADAGTPNRPATSAPVGSLRPVDPTEPPGRFARAYAALAVTRPARSISRHVSWKLDPLLLRITGGRLATTLVFPTAVLETRGAKSGERRRNAIIYFHDGEQVTVVASNAGSTTHPAWYHNLRAHPDVTFGGVPMRATVVDDERERERLWVLADCVFPAFARYRQDADEAGRTIPIVQLTRREPEVPD